MTDRERLLDELRPVSFAIAYRMLGSVSEAEDIVQEVLLRLHRALEGAEQIQSPRAFVATITPGWRSTSCAQIRSISSIVNPDKVTHLGPVGDLGSLLRSAR